MSTSAPANPPAPAEPPRLSTHSVHALRAVGALLVVLAHLTGPTGFEGKVFPDGPRALDEVRTLVTGIGVDVFFTLSGFFMLLTAAGPRLGRSPVRRTLWRRLVKVLPLYWLATTGVLAITLVLPGAVNGSQEHAPDVLASYLLLPQDVLPLLLVGWTLTHIVVFYGVFCLGLLTRSSRGLWAVLGAWSAFTATLYVVGLLLPEGTGGPVLQFLGNPLNLEFVMGAAVAQVLVAGRRRAGAAALAAGALLLAALLTLRLLHVPGTTSSEFRLLGVTTGVCLLLYGTVALEQRTRWRTPPALTAVATPSYSLYLVHVPLIGALAVVASRLPLPSGTSARVAVVLVALALCVLAARLVHRFVERPLAAAFEETCWSLPRDWLAGFRRRPAVVDVTTPAVADAAAAQRAAG
ncbi:acyltransferase [Paenibacillus sp. TRM 82003]|uniref:acyltransferase family protein n=1 Tax=Kineococcus sp. TRM81007 TaxID=2925831 RepID=UPI001F59F90B|nr:acyltransferase [Kineococcus sp. TRM81007]MCI2236938.1 acyltransferase [Kineococcus sp. TRM81007]MCI3921930.1 acyltransferase [Paenibacillus sp. TRM 82003]